MSTVDPGRVVAPRQSDENEKERTAMTLTTTLGQEHVTVTAVFLSL